MMEQTTMLLNKTSCDSIMETPPLAMLKHQHCPMCNQKSLTLSEADVEVPYFGTLLIFGMNCENCKYHKSDVEAAEQKEACKWSLEVSSKEDLNCRVVRSSEGLIKIPYVGSIEPGPVSEGFITTVEGVLNRIKDQVESLKESAEDDEDKTKAKNLLKKLQKVFWGEEKITLTIEDPSGNSAIISDKAKREVMKQKK